MTIVDLSNLSDQLAESIYDEVKSHVLEEEREKRSLKIKEKIRQAKETGTYYDDVYYRDILSLVLELKQRGLAWIDLANLLNERGFFVLRTKSSFNKNNARSLVINLQKRYPDSISITDFINNPVRKLKLAKINACHKQKAELASSSDDALVAVCHRVIQAIRSL